jgi:hypothetical protein
VPDRDRSAGLLRGAADRRALGPRRRHHARWLLRLGRPYRLDRRERHERRDLRFDAPGRRSRREQLPISAASWSDSTGRAPIPTCRHSNYLSFTDDHTRGTQPGYPTPTAMVADDDLAWASSCRRSRIRAAGPPQRSSWSIRRLAGCHAIASPNLPRTCPRSPSACLACWAASNGRRMRTRSAPHASRAAI